MRQRRHAVQDRDRELGQRAQQPRREQEREACHGDELGRKGERGLLERRHRLQQARDEITSLYDDAIRDLEIRALMARADEDDEEETLIRFLM